MYENVFKRVEEKYILTHNQKEQLLNKIGSYLEKDLYYESNICNIYFDTKDYDLIRYSLEKPIFKDKIRLRSYKIPSLDDDVFLEIKEKYKNVVGKRRIKMKLKEFYQFLEQPSKEQDNQIMKEITYYFNYYHLKPSIFISYNRHSFYSKENPNLRITFDSKLKSRETKLNLELGNDGTYYFDNESYIMEIKTLGAMPLWLVHALSQLKIYPTSFSKYGKIYEKKLLERKKLNYA